MTVTAACVDVTGSSRPMDIAYTRNNKVELVRVRNVDALVRWVTDHEPHVLAIDAPSSTNRGCIELNAIRYGISDGAYVDFRVCEAYLRQKGIGLYNTPQIDPPPWIKRGWQIYDELMRKGYKIYNEPGVVRLTDGTRYLIEVHPHASFVVGLGWIPQSKKTFAGLVERVAYLRKQAEYFGFETSDTAISLELLEELKTVSFDWEKILADGLEFPEISHDELDSIVGLFTAEHARRGDAFATGNADDGVIITPSELADFTYCTKSRS